MKILIAGGGLSGLTLAAFLRDSHIEYEIAEQAKDWSHEGLVIAIWWCGRRILEKLDLADALERSGTPQMLYSLRDGAGKVMREHSIPSLFSGNERTIIAVMRTELHRWLLEKADPARVTMGRELVSFKDTGEKVTATFSDGTTGEYDLIVGADGTFSKVRTTLFGEDAESHRNWRIWYAFIDKKFDTPYGTLAEFMEPGQESAVFSGGDKTMMWLFNPQPYGTWDEETGRVERLTELFKDLTALIPDSISSQKDEDIGVTDLTYVKLKKWHKGRVVLTGDSAHSFGPHVGMGGSMALEDGFVLADELLKVSDNHSLEDALTAYERRRIPRANVADRISRKTGRLELAQSKGLRMLSDILIHVLPTWYFMKDYNVLVRREP